MPHRPAIACLPARLRTPPRDRDGDRYRLLVVGEAILCRGDAAGPWFTRVTDDGLLLPLPPPLDRPLMTRPAAALLEPRDLPGVGRSLRRALRRPAVRDADPTFHGWALLYQLPGDRGVGRVDPHDASPNLPAFYESPLELADRQTFLARRGVPSRALALLAYEADDSVDTSVIGPVVPMPRTW